MSRKRFPRHCVGNEGWQNSANPRLERVSSKFGQTSSKINKLSKNKKVKKYGLSDFRQPRSKRLDFDLQGVIILLSALKRRVVQINARFY